MKSVTMLFLSATLLAAPVSADAAGKNARKTPVKSPAPAAVTAKANESKSARSVVKVPERLREKQFFYSSFGSRDPFRSLVGGDFEPKLQELVDLHTVQLVGVLWEDEEFVAMVQDSQGFGYNLRPGDRVRNGRVVSVGKDAMVGRLNVFGQTTRVTLRLQREE